MFRQRMIQVFYLFSSKLLIEFVIANGAALVFAFALLSGQIGQEGCKFLFPIEGNVCTQRLGEYRFLRLCEISISI